ncbi:hypothetical protein CkaCkLH20_10397 [Colletotrichum karsti]|uniref:Dynamin N-terminal domain-containing protein n=1 Tax=Colletotrichum karsti TaxID=1095194 RepID=A0A9P6HXQ4_9PEZI|nr:uncharacterized protein CkaCkLH20_10397 [Colletotrichum karsti]KAF9872060.1 hypothetical protein CkaCkLH20_10397 [Colletotrichum karsti]
MADPHNSRLPSVASSSTTAQASTDIMANAQVPTFANIEDRVKAKERIRELGIQRLQDIQEILKNDQAGKLQEVGDWIASLAILLEAHMSREILVGILGETGMGKSSLLNALLGSNIGPTSQSEACTAAVCIFAWSSDLDKKSFSAQITFKNRETVEADLYAFKEEWAEIEEAENTNGDDQDENYEIRLAEINQKVTHVQNWSGLAKAQIHALSPKMILKRSNAFAKFFRNGRGEKTENSHEKISPTNRTNFLNQLKPYVDSSKSADTKSPRYWPLVEKVEIFLSCEILRHGVKLVDLPGSQDALSWRSQVAENYRSQLDKRIVVAPATRAADNKAASDFIFSKQDSDELLMNDMMKSESLCVVVTKVDEIDCNSAESEFPNENIIQVCEALNNLEEAEEELTEEDEDASYQHEGKGKGVAQKSILDKETRAHVLESGKIDSSLSEDDLRFLLKHLCIEARNTQLKKIINDHLLEAMSKESKDGEAASAALPCVLPVSSKAFQDFKRKKRTLDSYGFPDRESTGIPALREWLDRVSLHHREEWADFDIHHIRVLLDAAHAWIHGDDMNLPSLDESEKTRVQMRCELISKRLKEIVNARVRTRLRINLSNMKPFRDSPLIKGRLGKHSKQGGGQLRKASEILRRSAKGWRLKNPWGSMQAADKNDYVYWSTYKASVKRYGGLFVRPARKGQAKSHIHWMADVQHAFWRGHHEKWKHEFTQRLPGMKPRVQCAGRKAFDSWIKDIYDDDTLPGPYRDLIKGGMYRFENLFNKYISEIRSRIDTFLVTSRGKRITLARLLAEDMRPGFEAAAAHTGKGILKKQAGEVENHVDAVSFTMFERARNELEEELAQELKQVSKDMNLYWVDKKTGCWTLITNELKRMARRLCADKAMRSLTPKIGEETKLQLSALIEEWREEFDGVQARLPQQEMADDFEDDPDEDPNIKLEEDEETGELYETFAPVMVKSEPMTN